MPFAATEVDAAEAGDRRQQGEKRRRVQLVAENIVAGARELGPRVSVLVPVFSRGEVVHRG